MSSDEPTGHGGTAEEGTSPGGEPDGERSPTDGAPDASPDERRAGTGTEAAASSRDDSGWRWNWLPQPLAEALPFAEPPSGPSGLTRDEVFELLSNERRRYVIRYLQSNDGAGELGDMATQVAAWEHDVAPDRVDSTERKRAYTTLQQSHLPKMDDMGAVDYDSDSGHVEATEALGAVDIYLEIVPGGELAWKEYYLALSIVSVALVAVVAVGGVYPFALLPDVVWAAVIAFAFLVSAAAHVYLDRSIVLGEGE
jgi:hypothetical protein